MLLHRAAAPAHQTQITSRSKKLPSVGLPRPGQPCKRMTAVITRAKAPPVPPELTGFWSTLLCEQLAVTIPGLDPRVSYLVSHGVGHLLVPLFEAWLVIRLLRFAAGKVQKWCEANSSRPLLSEVVGLLPAAIKGPTVFTLGLLVTLRLIFNAVLLLGNYLHKFSTATYGRAADSLLVDLCAGLRPMGNALVKVYSVVMLFYACTVLVKWKSIGLVSLLERERDKQEALIAASGGDLDKTRSMDDLERLLVPFDAATSWLMYAIALVAAAQLVGVDIAPFIAVGGAGSIILGLATQQLLTNAFMGLSLFFTRPFVDGDSVVVQGAGSMVVSGVVEKTTVMRTTLRTDDDVVVTIPNKQVADMIVFNRSAEVRRSRLASANRMTDNIKLRLKLPYAAEDRLREVQELVKATLEPPPGSSTSTSTSSASSPSPSVSLDSLGSVDESTLVTSTGTGAAATAGVAAVTAAAAAATAAAAAGAAPNKRSGSPLEAALQSLVKPRPARSPSPRRPGPSHPVVANSVEVVISRFTDSGLELLVKAKLRVEPSNSSVQALLLDLSRKVRAAGGMMINV